MRCPKCGEYLYICPNCGYLDEITQNCDEITKCPDCGEDIDFCPNCGYNLKNHKTKKIYRIEEIVYILKQNRYKPLVILMIFFIIYDFIILLYWLYLYLKKIII